MYGVQRMTIYVSRFSVRWLAGPLVGTSTGVFAGALAEVKHATDKRTPCGFHFVAVFEAARRDRPLRARLHWNNGTLAGPAMAPCLMSRSTGPKIHRDLPCPRRSGGYGGLPIVRAMARLFEWDEVACGPAGASFVAQWSMPASESGGRGDAE
jgi:hypothetical protein